jgi:GTP pyrophosphokinase
VDDPLVRFGVLPPVPGDSIVGFISAAAGSPSTRGLPHGGQERAEKERLVAVEWEAGEPAKRPVRIAVYIGRDRPGLLAEITSAISSRHGNIIKAEITVTEDRKGLNHFVVEVDDLRQLQDIMQAIREVKDIANVERVRGV